MFDHHHYVTPEMDIIRNLDVCVNYVSRRRVDALLVKHLAVQNFVAKTAFFYNKTI